MVSRHQELAEVATFKPRKPLTNNYVHKHSLSDNRGASPRNADLDLDEEEEEDNRGLEGPVLVGLPHQVPVATDDPSDDDDFEEFVQNDDDDADSVDNTNLQRLKPTRRKL